VLAEAAAAEALMQRSGSAKKVALMQRSDSIRRKRTRRRTLGLATAVAVHLLAVLSLLPVARLSAQDRSHPSDADAPVTVVQLVRLMPREAPISPQPEAAPKAKSVSLPETDAPFKAAPSEPEAPGPAPPARPVDNEALYRVPFRDAVGQADARLRAGLGCAHVDLEALPKSVFDLCSAMARFDDPARPRRPRTGPLG
jgi:hypothetical protein